MYTSMSIIILFKLKIFQSNDTNAIRQQTGDEQKISGSVDGKLQMTGQHEHVESERHSERRCGEISINHIDCLSAVTENKLNHRSPAAGLFGGGTNAKTEHKRRREK